MQRAIVDPLAGVLADRSLPASRSSPDQVRCRLLRSPRRVVQTGSLDSGRSPEGTLLVVSCLTPSGLSRRRAELRAPWSTSRDRLKTEVLHCLAAPSPDPRPVRRSGAGTFVQQKLPSRPRQGRHCSRSGFVPSREGTTRECQPGISRLGGRVGRCRRRSGPSPARASKLAASHESPDSCAGSPETLVLSRRWLLEAASSSVLLM